MTEKKYISYNDLRQVLVAVYENLAYGKAITADMQDKIALAKYIDESIKTHKELDDDCFYYTQHGPARSATFMLSYYAEHALDGASLRICNDDPIGKSSQHTNYYNLSLLDPDSHNRLYEGSGKRKSDFGAYFDRSRADAQITSFFGGEAGCNVKNTTAHPYDSFTRRYQAPFRLVEFKSAKWTSGKNTHDADYVIKFDYNYQDKLFAVTKSGLVTKNHTLVLAGEAQNILLKRYYKLLDVFSILENHSWDEFLPANE